MKTNTITRLECPDCGISPEDDIMWCAVRGPGKLCRTSVERTYVAVDALMSEEAIAMVAEKIDIARNGSRAGNPIALQGQASLVRIALRALLKYTTSL